MESSTKDKTNGKIRQEKGKIKETNGKAVGNEDLEAKGKGGKLEEKVQEKVEENNEVLLISRHSLGMKK